MVNTIIHRICMEIELTFALDPLHGYCDVTYVRTSNTSFFLFIAFSTYLAQFGKKIKMLIKGDRQACLPRC